MSFASGDMDELLNAYPVVQFSVHYQEKSWL